MAEIKQITIPDTAIQIGSGDDASAMTFTDFVRWTLGTHPSFNSDGQGIRASVRIESQLAAGGKKLTLDAEDYDRLRSAADSPQGGYPIRPASRLVPFLDAIEGARLLEPDTAEPEPAPATPKKGRAK